MLNTTRPLLLRCFHGPYYSPPYSITIGAKYYHRALVTTCTAPSRFLLLIGRHRRQPTPSTSSLLHQKKHFCTSNKQSVAEQPSSVEGGVENGDNDSSSCPVPPPPNRMWLSAKLMNSLLYPLAISLAIVSVVGVAVAGLFFKVETSPPDDEETTYKEGGGGGDDDASGGRSATNFSPLPSKIIGQAEIHEEEGNLSLWQV